MNIRITDLRDGSSITYPATNENIRQCNSLSPSAYKVELETA